MNNGWRIVAPRHETPYRLLQHSNRCTSVHKGHNLEPLIFHYIRNLNETCVIRMTRPSPGQHMDASKDVSESFRSCEKISNGLLA